jgi:O-antigen/teichoic acid export membrane protein
MVLSMFPHAVIERLKDTVVKHRRYLGDVATLSTSSVTSQGIVVLVTPLLSRMYTPADFAAFGVFMAITSVFGLIACAGYERAIVVAADDREARSLVTICITLAALSGALSMGLLRACSSISGSAAFIGRNVRYPWALSFCIFAIGYSETYRYWFTRTAGFRLTAAARIWQSVIGSGVQLIMGAGRMFQGVGLIAGRVVGIFLSGGFLQANMDDRRQCPATPALHIHDLVKVARKHKDFPLFLSWSLVLGQAGYWAPTVLLALYFNPEVVGAFFLTVRAISAPMQFIGDAFEKVTFQRATRELKATGSARESVTTTLAFLIGISAVPGIILILCAPGLFRIAFGRSWELAGHMTAWLTPMIVFNFIACPLYPIFAAEGKQALFLGIQALRAAAGVLSITVVAALTQDIRPTLIAYSFVQCAMYLITIFLVLKYAKARRPQPSPAWPVDFSRKPKHARGSFPSNAEDEA